MKDNKVKYYNQISIILYALGIMIIIIPSLIIFISGGGFSAHFSKVILSIAMICMEIGLIIKAIVKREEGKFIVKEIGIIIGLLLVIIWGILK